jgi:ribosomal protein S18 acetylase RimI-like enzyme
MRARRFTDPRAFNDRIAQALASRERENNVLLGTVRGLTEKPDDRALMVVVEDGNEVACAAVMTPPFNVVVSTGPLAAMPPLVEHIRALNIAVPGVLSIAPMADCFVSAWRHRDAREIGTGAEIKLYALGAEPRAAAARGSLRAATTGEASLLADWATEFFIETGLGLAERDFFVARLDEMIAVPRLWLWDVDGRPACMVAHRETTTRTARIGPVYTPRRLRGNGYASAAVAELSRRLLAAGRAWCLLFADVENPTSTGIYRRLGYQEVCLFREYRFGA